MTEEEMVGWHHRFDGHEFEQALGVDDGQGGLACCGSWGLKELDTTERLTCQSWQEFHQGDGVSSIRHRGGTQSHCYFISSLLMMFCSLGAGGAGFVPCKVSIFLL